MTKRLSSLCLAALCMISAFGQTRHLVANSDGVEIAYLDPTIKGAIVTHKNEDYKYDKYTGSVSVPRYVNLPAPTYITESVQGERLQSDGTTTWVGSETLKWTSGIEYYGCGLTFCGDTCPVLRLYFEGGGEVAFEVQARGGGSLRWGAIDSPLGSEAAGSLSSEGTSSDGEFTTGTAVYGATTPGIHYAEFSGTALEAVNTELRVLFNANALPAEGSTATFEVYAVDEYAFRSCKTLTSLTLPPSIEEIQKQALAYNDGLKTLTISSPAMPSLGKEVYKLNTTPSPKPSLFVPEALVEQYKASADYTNFNVKPLTVPVLSHSEILPKVGSQARLQVTGMAEGAKAEWSTTDASVATVDADGLVTAVRTGSCAVRAYAEPYWLECAVTVMPFAGVERGADGGFRASEIEVADGEAYDSPFSIEADEIVYNRQFAHAGWHALYVPFAISYDEWSPYGVAAQFNNMHQYDKDGDGVREVTVVEFNAVLSGSLLPSTPYVFKPTQAGNVEFRIQGKRVEAAPEHPVKLECSSTSMTYAMSGTYQPMSGADTEGIFCLSGGEFMQVADGATLRPMRIYITMAPKDNAYGAGAASAPRRIGIMVDGEETSQPGLEAAVEDEANAPLYDLCGRRVENPAPGIYVRAGKKIVIR